MLKNKLSYVFCKYFVEFIMGHKFGFFLNFIKILAICFALVYTSCNFTSNPNSCLSYQMFLTESPPHILPPRPRSFKKFQGKTETLGRAKRKGLGERNFYPPSLSTIAEFRANEVDTLLFVFFSLFHKR
jgi:hypothetical protein